MATSIAICGGAPERAVGRASWDRTNRPTAIADCLQPRYNRLSLLHNFDDGLRRDTGAVHPVPGRLALGHATMMPRDTTSRAMSREA